MDTVLINPTDNQILDALVKAESAANPPRTRARTVSWRSIQTWIDAHPWHDIFGYRCWDGGGVPNNYRSRATTSVAGIAWWTGKRKHFRFYGARVSAPKSSYASVSPQRFGMKDKDIDRASYLQLVYPVLLPSHPPKRDKGLIPELLRALEEDCSDRGSWMALADRLTELLENRDFTTKTYGMTPTQCQRALQALDVIEV